jgi:hypothetical protein
MKRAGLAFVLVAAMSAAAGVGAEQVWAGTLSDSACGGLHEEAAEGAGKMSEHDCTLACVRGGSKLVLVSDGKVLTIANQEFAGLMSRAGSQVKLTGSLVDGAIVVTRVE